MIMIGMYDMFEAFPVSTDLKELEANMSGFLTLFAENQTSQYCPDCPGYNVLNKKKMPFDLAVGDRIGLFPVGYLSRYERGGDDRKPYDITIITDVVDKYILLWPHRLPDDAKTFSRKVCMYLREEVMIEGAQLGLLFTGWLARSASER